MAEQAWQECLAGGGGEDECKDRARHVLWTCLQNECGLEPPQPPCEVECHHKAERVYEACLDDGGSMTDCAERARAFLSNCLKQECGIDLPEPPCELRCNP